MEHVKAHIVATREPQHADALPKRPSQSLVLEFTGRTDGWPPGPHCPAEGKTVRITEFCKPLTQTDELRIRKAALRDKRVKAALGRRFAHILTDPFEAVKRHRRIILVSNRTKIIFFSYSKSVTVEVLIKGTQVDKVKIKRDYSPPEGDDEIAEAIALARNHPNLKQHVKGLVAHAILLPPMQEQPGYGNRIIGVNFTKGHSEDEEMSQFYASVDLTDRKVISAGAAAVCEIRKKGAAYA